LKKRVIIADRAKGIFISNISHELRSPLHGILASAEFLSDTRLDVLQRTFIDTVGSCGRTLLEVINHVLDFGKLMYVARLQNTVTRPHFQGSTSSMDMADRRETSPPADLAAVIEQVVEACYAGYEYKEFFGQIDMSSILGERGQKSTVQQGKGQQLSLKDKTSGLTVVIDIDQRDQGWICALQSGAVQRIVMNLTGNALKYTLSGWVKIHLSAEESEGQTTIQIIVSDSGKGISPEFLRSRLFSPFSQEDTLEAGTGLGMSIVKQVVERLRGDIAVSSQVGVGTQVRVTLPGDSMNQIATTVDAASQNHSSTRGMKVFLAGFNRQIPASRLTYQSIVKYLTNWYDMLVVDDVTSSDLIVSDECPELHDYFQQSCLATRPSLKFDALSRASSSDASTPDAETSQDIYRAPQPLIVLCSNALRYEYFGQQADSKKIINFVSKPCGPHKLAKTITYCFDPIKDSDLSASLGGEPHGKLEKRLAADRPLNVSDEDIAAQSPPSSPSVLIVEDNAVNSMIIATFLQKKGYSFEQAENGLVAVNAVKARPKGFDVIFMDIQSTTSTNLTDNSAGNEWVDGYCRNS
jgi:signal transduction histidine kinase